MKKLLLPLCLLVACEDEPTVEVVSVACASQPPYYSCVDREGFTYAVAAVRWFGGSMEVEQGFEASGVHETIYITEEQYCAPCRDTSGSMYVEFWLAR